MSDSAAQVEWLTVPQMVADLGGSVSDDKVRNWCRNGAIEGVMNIGDGAKTFYRVRREAWERFKASRRSSPPPVAARRSFRLGTNHIGI